jgi:hypothetical protein
LNPPQRECTRTISAKIAACLLILGLLLPAAPRAGAYAVLTHEAIVDSAWDDAIRPALLQRFPNTTADDLRGTEGPKAAKKNKREWPKEMRDIDRSKAFTPEKPGS